MTLKHFEAFITAATHPAIIDLIKWEVDHLQDNARDNDFLSQKELNTLWACQEFLETYEKIKD